MPTSARTSLGFFGQFADVGIRAPQVYGLLQKALASSAPSAQQVCKTVEVRDGGDLEAGIVERVMGSAE